MLSTPDTQPIDFPTLHSEIDLPYTLTPGRATGTFLAEIGNRKIVGSRFASGLVIAPAEDFSPDDGEDAQTFVEAPHTGVLRGFTQVDDVLIGLIQLDGCDNEFAHIVLADLASLETGVRVEAVWADGVENSILAIEGFRPAPDAPIGQVSAFDDPASPIEVIPIR